MEGWGVDDSHLLESSLVVFIIVLFFCCFSSSPVVSNVTCLPSFPDCGGSPAESRAGKQGSRVRLPARATLLTQPNRVKLYRLMVYIKGVNMKK